MKYTVLWQAINASRGHRSNVFPIRQTYHSYKEKGDKKPRRYKENWNNYEKAILYYYFVRICHCFGSDIWTLLLSYFCYKWSDCYDEKFVETETYEINTGELLGHFPFWFARSKTIYFNKAFHSFRFERRTLLLSYSCTAQKMKFPADLTTFTEKNFIFCAVLLQVKWLILTQYYTEDVKLKPSN